ncbi:MAG: DNA-binding protein WhiA [Caldicoprobacterales bacterium]|jgi:DNA-binding protein WhiA|nr:DNA-binding protein WhiA [Clostridiales bacterium]
MSFSSRAKNELCHIPVQKSCCNLAELAALIQICGTIHLGGRKRVSLRVSTENAAIARRIFLLLKSQYNVQTEVMVRKNQRLRKNNNYYLVLSNEQQVKQILADTGILKRQEERGFGINRAIDSKLVRKRCCKRAYIRGAFLGGGSVSDPEKIYHLEIVTHSESYANSLCNLINEFGLNAKTIERKNNFVVYLKEGDQIVNLLNIIGAHSALLDLENIRIYKDMRNNINRIVNCETANLSKTINAAVRQIENIRYLESNYGLAKLSPSLREIAELRLKNPDASLRELGEMLEPPIGKSGVNHRLRKLDKIAEDLKNKGGEGVVK